MADQFKLLENGIVDTETGDYLEFGEGDRAAWLASQLADASEQAKAHGKRAALARQGLMLLQSEKNAAYPAGVATRRNGYRLLKQDEKLMREALEPLELTRDEWKQVALAGKRWDLERCPEPVANELAPYQMYTWVGETILLSPVFKAAEPLGFREVIE